jgi:hypothetical protein
LSDTVSTLLIGVAMVLLFGVSIVIQMWRTRRSPMGKVVGLTSDIRYNEKLCDNYREDRGFGRFKTSAWDKHQGAVDFLPEELQKELSKVFALMSELNVSIDTARKHGSEGYVSTSDVEKLKGPLASCAKQLQEWAYANINNPDYLPRKYGIFRRR